MASLSRAQLRRVFSDASIALLLYTAAITALSTLAALPYYIGMEELLSNDLYYNIVSLLIVYPAGLIVMKLGLRHLPEPRLVPQTPPTARQLFSGTAVALGLMYLSNLITQYLLIATETENLLDTYMEDTPALYLVLTTVIFAPICEEYIFRRLLLDRLLFLGDWTALLLSSLFFGLFHTNLYQFLYATVVGMVLGYIRIITGRMRWNVLLHMFINLFCGVLPNYLYDNELYTGLLGLTVIASIVYAIRFLIRNRPWKELYAGPEIGRAHV